MFGACLMQFRCHGKATMKSGLAHDLPSSMDLRKESNQDCAYSRNTFHWWQRAMQEYSSRKLTFPRDRLSAIAGVARYFNDLRKRHGRPATYFAGLWVTDDNKALAWQLLWTCEQPMLFYTAIMDMFWNEK